jgi:valyl-tRNA synthetase
VAARLTRRVLGHVLDQLLRLFHPVMPFVTEELWTALTGGESVVVAPWPVAAADGDPAAEAVVDSLMRLVTGVRRFRGDQGLRPSQRVPAVLEGIGESPLAPHEASIRALLRLTEPDGGFSPNASVQAEGITVQLDTSTGIDVAAERRRLAKELAAAQADAEVSQRKLASPSFVEKAPADVVTKSRDRLAAAQAEIGRLHDQLAALGSP